MKLLNHTSKYLSLLLLPLITIWAVAFYYAMLDEIYDSLDDGLGNQKVLLLKRAKENPTILTHNDFDKHIYSFSTISESTYKNFKKRYNDTLMYMHNEDDFEPVRVFESAIKQGNDHYKLKIITSMVEEDDLIQDLVMYLVILYVILIISILILNNLLLKKIWKPFYHAIAQLKTFEIEKENSIHTLSSNIDEFELLNVSLNKLIQKSSDSYIEQKQFIENASHELQTPLAIAINKLELFLENNVLVEKQTKDLASVMDNLARLTRLNKSLLLLSKIENKQFPDEFLIDLNLLTKEVVADFEDLASHRNMSIVIENSVNFSYQMNSDLAIILLTNLIKNALIHGIKDSTVYIKIENNSWTISNVGVPESLKRDQLFSRFKIWNSDKKSSGLGLAIAKAIVNKYGIDLSYNFVERHHFRLYFPKK